MSKNSNQETEAYNNHLAFSQTLLADQYKCTKYTEHELINWVSGDPPGYIAGAENNLITSGGASSGTSSAFSTGTTAIQPSQTNSITPDTPMYVGR